MVHLMVSLPLRTTGTDVSPSGPNPALEITSKSDRQDIFTVLKFQGMMFLQHALFLYGHQVKPTGLNG